jgi:hypothetical protein
MTEFRDRDTSLLNPTVERNERALALEVLSEFVGRFWRGEERLWKAFWLFDVIGAMAVAFAVTLVKGVVLDSLMWIGVGVIFWGLAVIAALAYQTWVYVSVWRCAFNVGWKGWGYICRLLAVVGVVGVIVGLTRLVREWGGLF